MNPTRTLATLAIALLAAGGAPAQRGTAGSAGTGIWYVDVSGMC